jgi:hypothetical protein
MLDASEVKNCDMRRVGLTAFRFQGSEGWAYA